MKSLIVTIVYLFLVETAFSNAFFVSVTNGKDSNVGSFEKPLQTIHAATEKMIAGDTCWMRGGTYRETIQPKNSGSRGAPIVFQNYNNEKVIVTGTEKISGFTKYENSIYVANVEGAISQVFAKGQLLNQASFPNFSISDMNLSNWTFVDLASNKTAIIDGLDQLSGLNGASVIALCGANWVSIYGKITNQNGNKITASSTSIHWGNYSSETYLGKGKGFVMGSLNLLDVPGEWHFQNNKLYVWAPVNGNPDTFNIEARVRLIGCNLNNLSNIVVRGIQFKAANVTLRNSENCVVDECSVRFPVPFFAFKNGFNRDATNPELWEGNGVEISGKGNVIKNCYIAHSWGDGLTVWGINNTVENCLVEDCDWIAIDSAPLSVTGTGHVIKNNTLRNGARSILVHRHLAQGKILNNDMSASGIICDDLGLTYSFYTNGDKTEMAYNLVHDNYSPRTGPGIYLDNGDSNYVVHHNVIWNCETGIRINKPSINNQIYNNTFFSTEKGMAAWGPDGTEMKEVKTWNNISDRAPFEGNDQKNNFVVSSEDFVSAETFDFALKEQSSVIDQGVVIEGITDGYSGEAPDAGAYEFGQAKWTAGANIQLYGLEDDVPFSPVELMARAQTIGEIVLTWTNQSSNFDGFVVERKLDGSEFVEIARVVANGNIYADTTVKTLQRYTYRVRLFNAFGKSSVSNYASTKALSDGSTLKLEAEECSSSKGVDIGADGTGSSDNGDWLMFENVIFSSNYNSMRVRMAVPAQYANQTVEFRIDELNGQLIGRLNTKSTGDWGIYQEQTCEITPLEGIHHLYVVFKGGAGVGNFDWFLFEKVEDTNTFGFLNLNNDQDFKLKVWPSPFSNSINVNFQPLKEGNTRILLLNQTGQIVAELYKGFHEFESIQLAWNCPKSLQDGFYFIQLINDNGNQIRRETKKMIRHTMN